MDSKVKILIIKEVNPCIYSNASNNRFLSLVEGLLNFDISIDVCIAQSFSSKNEVLKQQLESKEKLSPNYIYLSPFYIRNILLRKFFNRFVFSNSLYLFNRLKRKSRLSKFDYIWIDTGDVLLPLGIKLMKKIKSTRFFQERSEYSWIGFHSDKNHKRYLESFLPNLDLMAVMTLTLKNYYRTFLNNKSELAHIPMTVDLKRFSVIYNSEPIDERSYIAYCGTMNNGKDGVDILIKSFIKIMNDFPDIHLQLAGPLIPEKDFEIQQKIIEKNNVQDRIKYLGNMDKSKIPKFLSKAKILTLARPNSKQAEGGFPTKLGEYLATGNPVCVTDVGEIGNYLEDGKSAYIATPGSVESFASVLKKALQSDNSNSVGLNGRRVAEKYFSKDKQAKVLYDFFVKNL